MFKVSSGKGFILNLDNGWELSVQWGAGNYCENKLAEGNPFMNTHPDYGTWESRNAEILAFDNLAREYWKFPDGAEALGYCSVEQVLEFAIALKELPLRKSMEVWEAEYFGTEDKHPDGADHVASAIGLEPDVYRNDKS